MISLSIAQRMKTQVSTEHLLSIPPGCPNNIILQGGSLLPGQSKKIIVTFVHTLLRGGGGVYYNLDTLFKTSYLTLRGET